MKISGLTRGMSRPRIVTWQRPAARTFFTHWTSTTVYRRWGKKSQLIGEALLDQAATLTATPDTGTLRTDLEKLIADGATLVRTPPVRALFQVLLEATLGSVVGRRPFQPLRTLGERRIQLMKNALNLSL